MGAFEIPPFDRATLTTVRHAAERSAAGMLTTVAGGGDTIAALNAAKAADMFLRTCRPQAARSSSGSKARTCPESRR